MEQQVDYVYEVIQFLDDLDLPELEKLYASDKNFPDGVDPFVGRRWIINAIDMGQYSGINWILSKNVDLQFRDEEGRTPLHACLERHVIGEVTKYEVMRALIESGADVNAVGREDYSPLHLATVKEDLKVIDLLLETGADPNQTTDIDTYATPEEEARLLGKTKGANYLKEKISQIPKKPRRFDRPLGLTDPKPLD